ncbi:M23 family metallopeptidase [Brachybacterium sp. FME24]|uniref:M23 family metallopeptidase n=1 Tax=Brachybacterium sp. FME24 TaxID=2742605 RepID=UPI001866D233|nr:M23 family metallopeptidase [Brachybacterium sp. FME24]
MAPEGAGGSGVAGPVPGGPVVLDYPFQGRWLTQNSPADRVPSHGTTRFALDQSIDLVPVDERGRTAPIRLRSLLRPEPPTAFPGFGRVLLAPLSGVVHAVHEGEQDHPAMRGVPSLGYALTQGRRAAAGWEALAGNHVILRADDSGPRPVFVVLCHLRRGSIAVRPGQRIGAGERVGACGNSGNSTEPHLHLQAMDAADPSAARPLPITFPDGLPRNGAILDIP